MSYIQYLYKKTVEFVKSNGISITVAAVFLLALILRIWGIKFGLPNLYHPDEWAIVDRSLEMMKTGDYNPRQFGYPSLYMYMELVVFVFYFFYGVSKGLYTSFSNVSVSDFYIWGRFLTALLGSLTVYVTYLTGKQLFGTKAGLVASLLLTFSFLHVRDSHYITVDVPAVFFITLSLFFAARIIEDGKIFDHSMSGLFAGLAIATKWNTFPIVFSFVAAYLLFAILNKGWNGKIFYGFLFLAFGLFVGTPYAFLDLPTFLNTLGEVLAHYREGHPGFEASKPFVFYLQNLASSEGMGVTILISVLLGLLLSLARHKKQDIFLIIFPVFYFFLISRSKVTFPRNSLPLYPILSLYGGFFLAELFAFLKRRLKENQNTMAVVIFSAVIILMITFPAIRIIQFDVASANIDNRTAAALWIEQNIPEGSKIATEFYGPPISSDFAVLKFPFLDHNQQWFIDQGFDYIVFDGADYQRFFDESQRYPREAMHYKNLFKLGKVLKRFKSDDRVEPFLSPEIVIVKIGNS